ncbi:MAG: xylulokinase [Rubrobacteraceae bacterium]
MLLGLDLGTGSVKAFLISTGGDALGEGSVPYDVRSPRSGWAESSPEEWWPATVHAARSAIGEHGGEVAAIGLSGQMHGVVLSDADGRSLRDAILWADTRSARQLAAYQALGEDLRRRLANPFAVGMAGPTLLWLRDHEPESYGTARWALQPKDWLRLRLTGVAATEPSDASATLLYDLEADGWAFDIVEAIGLRGELLAPLTNSASVAGHLTRKAAEALGVRAGIPVAAGAADTAAAMLGSGLLETGTVQLTVGTGGQIVVPKDQPVADPHGRTHLYRSAISEGAGRWYSMAAIQNAGLALEWVRRVLGASWDEVYEEAFAVPPGAEGVTFLPYMSGERTPHFDPAARGAWIHLGLGHERGHLLRAALEGVAFSLRGGVEALEVAGTPVPELRLAGGGSAKGQWRQLLADVLRRPLRILPDDVAPVASARGAALLAGVASGAYRAAREIPALAPQPEVTVHPGEASADYEAAYARFQETYPRLGK